MRKGKSEGIFLTLVMIGEIGLIWKILKETIE